MAHEAAALDRWLLWLSRRTPRVRERIVRFNPCPPRPGQKLRGYYRRENPLWSRGWVSKFEVIAVHGREAWDRTPRIFRRHVGRRQYITREAFRDYVWLAPDDDPIRRAKKMKGGQWLIPVTE